MSELRRDPIIDRWVIIAPERANRPIELLHAPLSTESETDPFSEGNESITPGELFAIRESGSAVNGPGWTVRAFPNKYPAVSSTAEIAINANDFYRSETAVGSHEVIVECPHDEANLSHLSVLQTRDILLVYRERIRALSTDSRIQHALIFKNQGLLAGASIRHAHSQLIASQLVPIVIQDELAGAENYYINNQRSVFDTIIELDRDAGRVILETNHFVALCPFASRFAYEMWIVPKAAQSHYEQIDEPQLEELGQVLNTVLRKLESAVNNPPFNLVLHSTPLRHPSNRYYRWHFEILPRTTGVAGYEWGSGCFINPVIPEAAAIQLREVFV